MAWIEVPHTNGTQRLNTDHIVRYYGHGDDDIAVPTTVHTSNGENFQVFMRACELRKRIASAEAMARNLQ